MFLLDAERAHHLTLFLFRFVLSIPIVSYLLKKSFRTDSPRSKLMGLDFPNRLGLAAGFDKDGKNFEIMAALGFGFVEIGTVTPRPQKGNERPRLFRLPNDEALINRMGFNNDGVDAMVQRLSGRKERDLILGANIGKNKDTPNEKAVEDYLLCFEKLFHLVDYFVVNVSSPNTPGLRDLQDKEPLTRILQALENLNRKQDQRKPLLLKIAPDLTETQISEICEIVKATDIDGVVGTNTTIQREGLLTHKSQIEKIGNGGLSGKPVREISSDVLRQIRKGLGPEKVVIGVGGISDGVSAQEKIDAGADVVQVYSGLIYEGPWMVKRICTYLARG